MNKPWTKARNRRRHELINRKHLANDLTDAEVMELAELQAAMLAYSRERFPLPIKYAEELLKQIQDR